MNAPDTQTEADKLEGTNVPEFHEALRVACTSLEAVPGSVTIWRDKNNRRAFGFTDKAGVWIGGVAVVLTKPEKIVTIRTGAAWEECTTPLSAVGGAVTQALGYHWRAVGAYFAPGEGLGLAVKGRAPRGSRLIVLAVPHPAGFSK